MAEKVKVNLYMSPNMLSALKRLAELQDLPYAEVVRTACKEYIVANAQRIATERGTIDSVPRR
jgi:hypothetical protein